MGQANKIMTNNVKNIQKNRLQERKELAQSFLLYNFLRMSQKQRDEYFDEQVPEVILRTMKLEGEDITLEQVKKICKK